eukprot:XP_016663486.1 PREDICTED: scm-like with four MBT domains protein 1 [Acyrthosiphon pisum]
MSLSRPNDLPKDQSSLCDNLLEEKIFDWGKYFAAKNVDVVPEDFFHHICKSELNGIEIGSVIEIENEDQNGYWFASVCSSKGAILHLHYFGDEKNTLELTVNVKSPRIHSLNWGSKNNKKCILPYPERMSYIKPEIIKEKAQDCEQIVSNVVLQMGGAPIHSIFKCDMFVEVQDKEYPYWVWISKVLKNVGGRLFLQMQGIKCSEKKPFWLFYLNKRIFPLGWAEQKGLPWRLMNSDASLENSIDSSALLDVLKPKTPEHHSYKVGDMLEVINPYSMMVFYVATIVKIYDNRYFKVLVDNDIDVDKRISFVATKDNPHLFHAGWASEHKFLLKTPSDWNEPYKFSWLKYLIKKKAKFASVDNSCVKNINNVHIGMKLEAVDPLNTDCIRMATVIGFADHWMFLSFDHTSCYQDLRHLRSIYSDEVFPVGWCNKHKYNLGIPKPPYNVSNDFEHCYYLSDIDINLSQSDEENVTKYPHYLKEEIFYHFSKKDKLCFDDSFEEKNEEGITTEDFDDDLPLTSQMEIKNDSDNDFPLTSEIEIKNDGDDDLPLTSEIDIKNNSDNDLALTSIIEIKIDNDEENFENDYDLILDVKYEPGLDEEFYDALFVDEAVDIKSKKMNSAKEIDSKKNKKVNDVVKTIKKVDKTSLNIFSQNNNEICIYFNKDCYYGGHVVKKKIANLPESIGPGPISLILQEAITIIVNLNSFPWIALKKIKKNKKMLFNGPGGVEMRVSTNGTRTQNSCTESLLLPESKKMAATYCSALCNLFGMCELFMNTKDKRCRHGCRLNYEDKTPLLKPKMDTVLISKSKVKRCESHGDNIVCPKITLSQITSVAEKVLDWSNESLVARYKNYLGTITSLNAHVTRLNQSQTKLESSLIAEIISKKNSLRRMDNMKIFSNTKSKVETIEEKQFIIFDDWKTTFENYYRQNSRFQKFNIGIGQFEHIMITSNPKYWSSKDVYNYLTNDLFCKDVGLKLYTEEVDGIAFMLLNEEQLLVRLQCTINLTIRILCHVAEVKYVCLTKYCNIQVD